MKRTKPLTPVPWNRQDKTPEPDPITAEVRRIVKKRSQGLCELCGEKAQHMHHRQLRRGGDHSAANLVHLCNICHRRVHSHPTWAYTTGWLVPQHANPAYEPLLLNGEWVRLDRDGHSSTSAPNPNYKDIA